MYGTVAHMRLKPGMEAQLKQLLDSFAALKISGFIHSYFYRMDADPNDCYLAVVFESKEAYQANAASPEQDARYQEMLALLEGPPEWHDGAVERV